MDVDGKEDGASAGHEEHIPGAVESTWNAGEHIGGGGLGTFTVQSVTQRY